MVVLRLRRRGGPETSGFGDGFLMGNVVGVAGAGPRPRERGVARTAKRAGTKVGCRTKKVPTLVIADEIRQGTSVHVPKSSARTESLDIFHVLKFEPCNTPLTCRVAPFLRSISGGAP